MNPIVEKQSFSRGFTLLEVMIAVLVLSIGLLGLAALQTYAMGNNQAANYRTQATNLAYQLLDMARSHRGAVADSGGNLMAVNYNVQSLLSATNGTWSSIASSKPGVHTACTVAQNPVTCDRERWINSVRASLPEGRARTSFDTATGEVTIEICWRDTRSTEDSGTAASSGCTLDSEGYGQPTVGPDGSDWLNNAFWMRTRI